MTVDWDGYTIGACNLEPDAFCFSVVWQQHVRDGQCCSTGYYGRPFEARNKVMQQSRSLTFARFHCMISACAWPQEKLTRMCLLQAKGGSFAKDKDFFRFTIGNDEVIPAFEEAIMSMKEGGIRRIVVPVELGYPDNDMYKKGPTPTTFSVSLLLHASGIFTHEI